MRVLVDDDMIQSGLEGNELNLVLLYRPPWTLRLLAHDKRIGIAPFDGLYLTSARGMWIDDPTADKLNEIASFIEKQTDEDISVLEPLGYRCTSFYSYRKQYDRFWIEVARPVPYPDEGWPLKIMECRKFYDLGPGYDLFKEITHVAYFWQSQLLESVLSFEKEHFDIDSLPKKEYIDILVKSHADFEFDIRGIKRIESMSSTWSDVKEYKVRWRKDDW